MGDNRFDEYLLTTSDEVADGLVNGRVESLRTLGVSSIVLALLWVYGLGSVLAIGMAAIGLMLRNRAVVDPLPGVRLVWIGLGLGVVGLAAAILLVAL